jgi:16S rRNA (adenine1518-N6/adenine1519-N6)-dimethyltransferase
VRAQQPARKRFGQHFLHDRQIVRRIIAAFSPRPGEAVVEIGPGQGVLTRALLPLVTRLHVVELDRDLVSRLQIEFGPDAKLMVHSADALEFDFSKLAPAGTKLRIIGNLPYNISTPLLFHLLEHAAIIQDMLFMLQKEVVDRLSAGPGEKNYGRLSVMIQSRCEVEGLFTVGSGAFRPAPKVDSAMVALRPYRAPPISIADRQVFADVVRAAFAHRRKTLRNNLKDLLPVTLIAASGIDPARRAETLSLAEFAALSNLLAQGRNA